MPKASVAFCVSAGLALGMSGCTRPTVEGGQVEELPAGFAYDPNCRSYGGIRYEREVLRQRCWFTHGEPASSVVVTELKGLVGPADLERGLAAEVERRKSWIQFEPVETLRIARRPAWGWHESVFFQGKTTGSGFTAVIPWDDRTYTVEFSGRREQDRDRALARRVVQSFAVRRSGSVHWGKVAVALLLVAGGFGAFRRLRRVEAEKPPPAGGPLGLHERADSTPPRPLPRSPKR